MRSWFFPTTAAGQVAGLFLCCLFNGLALATEPNFPETPEDKTQAVSSLRTFDALYKTSALGMTLDLKRSLTQEGGTYTLSSRGKNMLINMKVEHVQWLQVLQVFVFMLEELQAPACATPNRAPRL